MTARARTRSRERRAWWVVASALAAFSCVTEVRAQTRLGGVSQPEQQAFRVVFSSSSVCDNPSEFVEQLQRRTSHLRPVNAVEPALTFFVSLTSTQAGVQGQLRVQNPDGTGSSRAVPGLDCHEVLSAMALIAALVVDPFALTTEELPPPPPPPLPPRPMAEPPRAETPPAARTGWSFGAGQRLNVNPGVLPGLGWGESLFLEAALPGRGLFLPSARLAGHRARSLKQSALDPPLGSGEFTWTAARLSLCPVLWSPSPSPSLSLRPCAFVDAGQLFARGIAVATGPSRNHYLFWAAMGPEVELEFTVVGPLTLGAELGWMFPLVQPDFFYFVPRQDHVHQISSGLAAGLGLGLRFF